MFKYLTAILLNLPAGYEGSPVTVRELEFYDCPNAGVVVDYQYNKSDNFCNFRYDVEFKCKNGKTLKMKNICEQFLKEVK